MQEALERDAAWDLASAAGTREAPFAKAVEVLRVARTHGMLNLRQLDPVPVAQDLMTVLIADVVGYTRLIADDTFGTAMRIRHLRRNLIEPAVQRHGGWIVDQVGDGLLAAFPLAASAIDCAVGIQRLLHALEECLPSKEPIRLRIGISAGEVLIIEGVLYGGAISVAARLTALAGPGEIYVAESALAEAEGIVGVPCEPLGQRPLHNVAEPVPVFRIAHQEPTRTTAT